MEGEGKGGKASMAVAVALIVLVIIGIVALSMMNKAGNEKAAEKYDPTESEKELIAQIDGDSQKMEQLERDREEATKAINATFDDAQELISAYNALPETEAANGEGARIKLEIASLLGVDATTIDGILDENGRFGGAADEYLSKLRGEKMLEAGRAEYEFAFEYQRKYAQK